MKTTRRSFLGLAVLLAPLLVFAADPIGVSGTVKLPKGENVPEGAVVQIEVRDLSQTDAKLMLVSKSEIRDAAGKNEVAFDVACDAGKIKTDHAYAASCRIIQKGKLLFINTDSVPVITRGGKTKDIELPVIKPK